MDIYSVLRFDASEASDCLVSYPIVVLGNLYEYLTADSRIGFDSFMSNLIERYEIIATNDQVKFAKAFLGFCPLPRAWNFASNLLDEILHDQDVPRIGESPWAIRVTEELNNHRHHRQEFIGHLLQYKQLPIDSAGHVINPILPVPFDLTDPTVQETRFINGEVTLSVLLPDNTSFRLM